MKPTQRTAQVLACAIPTHLSLDGEVVRHRDGEGVITRPGLSATEDQSVNSARKRLQHDPVPVSYAGPGLWQTGISNLKTRVTLEEKARRGGSIRRVFRRQREILDRLPVQRSAYSRDVINDLTGTDITAVTDGQELLKGLSWTRLEARHGARVVVYDIDDREEDHLTCRYCAVARRVKTGCSSQEPYRPMLADRTVGAGGVEIGVDGIGYGVRPLPPLGGPLLIGLASGKRIRRSDETLGGRGYDSQ